MCSQGATLSHSLFVFLITLQESLQARLFCLQQRSNREVVEELVQFWGVSKCWTRLILHKDVLTCCIPDTFYGVTLTSVLGMAAGVRGVSVLLLSFGATVPASECWLWPAFVFLASTEWWPGEGWSEEEYLAGDVSAVVMIWWHDEKTKKSPFKAGGRMSFFLRWC